MRRAYHSPPMASERIIALRQRHDALYGQLEAVRVETDELSADLDEKAVEDATGTLRSACEGLRQQLHDLLGGRTHRVVESADTLSDANSLLNQIVMKNRAIVREIMKLKRDAR